MRQRLKAAAEEGIVIGVKVLAVVFVITLGMGWFMNDYAHVRSIALKVEAILQRQEAQAQQQSSPPQRQMSPSPPTKP